MLFDVGDADNFLGELVIPSSWWPPLNSKVTAYTVKNMTVITIVLKYIIHQMGLKSIFK